MSVGVGVGVSLLGGRSIFAQRVGLFLVFIERSIPDEMAISGEQDLIVVCYLFILTKSRFVDDARLPLNISCRRLTLESFELFHGERFAGLIPTPEVLKIERLRLILEILVFVKLLTTRLKSAAQAPFHQPILSVLWKKEPLRGHIPRLGQVHLVGLFVLLKKEKGQSCPHALVYVTAIGVPSVTGIEYLPQPVGGKRLKKKREILDRITNSVNYPIPFLTYAGLLIIVPISDQKLPVAGSEDASITVEIAVTIVGHVYRICIITSRLSRSIAFELGVSTEIVYSVSETAISVTVITPWGVEKGGTMATKRGATRQDSENDRKSEYNQPHRKTPYTTISVTPEVRDGVRDLRDDLGYETYCGLFRHIIQNERGDPTNE